MAASRSSKGRRLGSSAPRRLSSAKQAKRAADFILSSERKRRRRRSRQSRGRSRELDSGDGDVEKMFVEAMKEGGEDVEELKSAFEDAREADEMEKKLGPGAEGSEEDEESAMEEDVRSFAEEGRRSRMKIYEDEREGQEGEDDEDDDPWRSHRKQLEELKTSDPSFYKYLQENDKELLEFEDGDDHIEDNEGDEEDEGSESHEGGEEDEEDKPEDQEEEEMEDRDVDRGRMGDGELDVRDSDDSEEKRDEEQENANSAKAELVDLAVVRRLSSQLSLKRNSIKAAKDLMRYFRAGRLLTASGLDSAPTKKEKSKSMKGKKHSDSESEGEDDGTIAGGKVRFSSARVYQKIMSLSVTKILPCIDRAVKRPSKVKHLSRWDPSQSPRWENIRKLLKSYSFHFAALISSTTHAPTLRFLLRQAAELAPYAVIESSIYRSLSRVAVEPWSNGSLSAPTRVSAFMLLRSLGEASIRGKPSNLPNILKLMCTTYREKVASSVSSKSLSLLEFCAECVADMFGVDLGVSYVQAFNLLRDIAVLLRGVLTAKERASESERVHNWSTINTLRFLGLVLQRYGTDEDGLKPLVYPYIQLCNGVIRLSTSPRVHGLRLCVCKFMIDVMEGTSTFVPAQVPLLEIFRWAELRKRLAKARTPPLAKTSRRKAGEKASSRIGEITMGPCPIDFRCILRVSEEVARSPDYLAGVVKETLALLGRFYAVLSRSVALPEIAHPAIAALRGVAREVPHRAVRRAVMVLVEVLKENEAMVVAKRARWKGTPQGVMAENGGAFGNVLEWGEKRTPMERYWDMERKRMERENRLRDQGTVNLEQPAEKASGTRRKTTDSERGGEDLGGKEKDSRKPEDNGKRPRRRGIEFRVPDGEETDVIEELQISDEDDGDDGD